MEDHHDLPQGPINRWLSQWAGVIGGTVIMSCLIGHIALPTLGYAS